MPEAGKKFIRAPQGRVPKFICGVVTGMVVVVALAVFITWLTLQPHKPKYYLEYGSSSKLLLSEDGRVTSKLQFNLTTRNSNKRIAIYYDRIGTALSYGGDEFAWGSLLPFYQGHKNTTFLHTSVTGEMVPLQSRNAHDLKLEHSSGKVDLEFKLYALIRFKVGSWKSGHYTVRVKCRKAKLDVAEGTFKRTKCKVHV